MSAYQGFQPIQLTVDDPAYPDSLRELQDNAPKRLYLFGDTSLLARPALAIVGSRKATPYGLACAKRFASRAAFHGLVIVSGGAIGCDQAAHQGALELDAPTIVVLGCGADVVYPSQARPLFEQVLAKGGLLLSEVPWGSHPARHAFVRRNRLIAGLAQATLVVEAGMPSGTFSTVDATLNLGRELLAVPGSILSRQSEGCNHLIAQGAWPIISDISFDTALADIFHPLPLTLLPGHPGGQLQMAIKDNVDKRPSAHAPATADLAAASDPTPDPIPDPACPSPHSQPSLDVAILERLRAMPSYPDELVGECGKDVIEVIRYLSAMEFAGLVTRMIDGRFAAVPDEMKAADDARADYDSRRRPGRQRGGLAAG